MRGVTAHREARRQHAYGARVAHVRRTTMIGGDRCDHDVSKPRPTRGELERREDRAEDHRCAASRTRPAGRWTTRRRRTRDDEGCASSVRASASRAVRQAIGEIAKLPDADEATRQDVLDEAPQKLHRGQRHRAPLVAVRVVLPAEGDALAIEGDQPMIADGDAMGIAAEIAQHRRGPTEGRLRIDDPVGVEERIDEGVPTAAGSRSVAVAPARSSSFARVRPAQCRRRICRETPD